MSTNIHFGHECKDFGKSKVEGKLVQVGWGCGLQIGFQKKMGGLSIDKMDYLSGKFWFGGGW